MAKSATEIEKDIRAALRVCSLEARGLWCSMRYVIDDSDRPGHLRQNGRPMSELQLAREAGCDSSMVTRLLQELQDATLIVQCGDDGYRAPMLARLEQLRAGTRERVRQHRGRRPTVSGDDCGKTALRNTPCNTPCNTDVTPNVTPDPSPPLPPPSPTLPPPISPSTLPFSSKTGDGGASPGGQAASGAKPGKPGKKPKLTMEENPVWQAFIGWYCTEAWPARHNGVPYTFDGSRDGKGVRQVLQSSYVKWDLDRAKAVANAFLEAHVSVINPRARGRNLWSLGEDINHWSHQAAARAAGKSDHVAPNRKPTAAERGEFPEPERQLRRLNPVRGGADPAGRGTQSAGDAGRAGSPVAAAAEHAPDGSSPIGGGDPEADRGGRAATTPTAGSTAA